MALYKIMCVKAVFCPKKLDLVFLSDCEECEHFGGRKRHLRYNYVDCKYPEKVILKEVDSDGQA